MTVTEQEPILTRNRVEWATVPKVNLLPPEILEGRRFRTVQTRLAAVVVGVVVAGLGATVWAHYQVRGAESELALATAQTTALQQEAATYAEVPLVLAQVDAAEAARETAMGTDVLWYRFLDELALATPAKVDLADLDVTMATGGTVASGNADPLSDTSLGEVVVNGTTTSMPDVAGWLTSVGSVHGLDTSRLQTAARESSEQNTAGDDINFTTAIGITADALSHRYDRKVG